MQTYDFSPLYRSFVGFDRMASLIDAATQSLESNTTYPPYNVAQIGEDEYHIEIAVAGFSEEDLDIQTHQNVLSIIGRKSESADPNGNGTSYLHRGIAERGFERRFQLADHVHVMAAELRDGLLKVILKREVPEALKPRKIAIAQPNGKLISRSGSRKARSA